LGCCAIWPRTEPANYVTRIDFIPMIMTVAEALDALD
jgi:hypothetical protein